MAVTNCAFGAALTTFADGMVPMKINIRKNKMIKSEVKIFIGEDYIRKAFVFPKIFWMM